MMQPKNSFLSDSDVIQRILDHVRHQTTDRSDVLWKEPVKHYLSETRFHQELALIKQSLLPFCPSATLSEAGSYVARDMLGTAVLVLRDKEGQVRAFINACRHRGTQLVTGEGCRKALVCPYHGWAYQLDGSLHYVPHEDGFPDLDKSTHGLVPLYAEERQGLVFVSLVNETKRLDEFESLDIRIEDEQQVIASDEMIVDANWKVYLESFIEGYHIKYTHKDSFYPFGYDNLNLVEHNGVHSRVTYPFRRIESQANVGREDQSVDGQLTFVYHLFPNVLITVLTHHTNLIILEPLAINRTRSITYRLTNRGSQKDAMERAKNDLSFVGSTGAAEDMAVVMGIQNSILSGANDHFTFGHFESAIAHFHRTMTARLDNGTLEEFRTS